MLAGPGPPGVGHLGNPSRGDDGLGHLVGVKSEITVDACTDVDGDPLAYDSSATNGSMDPSTTTTGVWHRLIIGGRVQRGDVTVVCRDPAGTTDSALVRFF